MRSKSKMMAYFLMFGAAFLAATLLPFSSEVIVVGMVIDRPEEWLWILLVASLGNTLGSAFNWVLGRYFQRFQDRRWFPFKAEGLSRSQKWFQKYGVLVVAFGMGTGGGRCPYVRRRNDEGEFRPILDSDLRGEIRTLLCRDIRSAVSPVTGLEESEFIALSMAEETLVREDVPDIAVEDHLLILNKKRECESDRNDGARQWGEV